VPTSSAKTPSNRSLLLKRGLRLMATPVLALTLAGACSDPDSPPGYRERSGGSGGGGNNSVAGTTGEAGDSMGGTGGEMSDAGASTGGKGGRGGTGGKGGSGGGSGGTGGMGGPTCGDMKIEGDEECEDGNVLNFDGCSSDCKSRCESCLDEFYGEDGDYLYLVDACSNSMERAGEGPAAGTLRSKLCQDLVACIVNSGCAKQGAANGAAAIHDRCYCGAVDAAECEAGGPTKMGNPQGPCVAQYAAAAESRTYIDITVARTSNITLGIGMATELLKLGATTGYCVDACAFDKPVDDCTRCAAGDVHTFTPVTAICPTCFAPACDLELAGCAREKCKGLDVEQCLATNGPCAAEVAAVTSPSTLENTKVDLRCRAQTCAAECFKP
jgi:cysteine-rich repeat protein